MTTKQLNVSGPRNFKEKIELLKRKEAACTACFTAAIRDAREIRQIVGLYDTKNDKSRLRLKELEVSNSSTNNQNNDFKFLKLLSDSLEKTESFSSADHVVPVTPSTSVTYTTAVTGSPYPSVARVQSTHAIRAPHRVPAPEFRTCSSSTNVPGPWPVANQQKHLHFAHSRSCTRSMHAVGDYASYGTPVSTHVTKPYAVGLAPGYSNLTYPPSSICHSQSHIQSGSFVDRKFDTRSFSVTPFTTGDYVQRRPPAAATQPFTVPYQFPECTFAAPLPSQMGHVSARQQPYQPAAGFTGPSQFVGSHSMECRRVSSDSSIRQSVISAQLAAQPSANMPASMYGHPPYQSHASPVKGNHNCRPRWKNPYVGQDEHGLPVKRMYTLSSSENVCTASGQRYAELQKPAILPAGTSQPQLDFSQPNDMLDNHLLSDDSSSRSDFTQKLNNAFLSASSAPNINIHTESHDPATTLEPVDQVDLDRYLQIPSALLDGEDGKDWVGRRDSCTMTAEVLSALSANASNHLDQASPPAPHTSTPPTMLSSQPFNEFNHPPTSTASCVQVVANRLGISMNSNDYQLLTDPQLSNYVTDESTEAQLLQ